MLNLDTHYLGELADLSEIAGKAEQIRQIHTAMHEGKGEGAEALGWLSLPKNYDKEEYRRIKRAAMQIRGDSAVLLVIGAGGSYLGAKAAIEFLHTPLYNQLDTGAPEIYFIGHNLSAAHLEAICAIVGERDFSVNVISKSGTTSEPAIAFRIVRNMLEQRYGIDGAAKRIYCTTDGEKGAMRSLADAEGYTTFTIPQNIGGRYSVLTAVGLLPIAVSGGDTDSLLAGAKEAQELYSNPEVEQNSCYAYAAIRNILYSKGRCIELLVTHDPALEQFSQWYRQLFAESEGKEGKGIFPATANFTRDLHSIGQYIQEGSPNLFETVIWVEHMKGSAVINPCRDNLDGLDYLNGHSISEVGRFAMKGAVLAHTGGGTPNIILKVDKQDEFHLGVLFYFFEKACAMSAYMLGVNPFDQPGVEEYKANMFALACKPGYTPKEDSPNKNGRG